MLCERCQKNEANHQICFASGTFNYSGADSKDRGLPVPPDPPPRHLCAACYTVWTQELIPDGSGQTIEGQVRAQNEMMAAFEIKRREFCTRIGLTLARQKQMLADLEADTPGLFDLKFTETPQRDKIELQMRLQGEKIKEAVAACFPAGTVLRSEIGMVAQQLNGLKTDSLVAQRTAQEIAAEYPSSTPEDRAGLRFLRFCLYKVMRRMLRPGRISAGDILAVAGEAAGILYGESAREELRAIGVVSSATLGDLVYRLIEKGMLGQDKDDRPEDFHVQSEFDAFLAGG